MTTPLFLLLLETPCACGCPALHHGIRGSSADPTGAASFCCSCGCRQYTPRGELTVLETPRTGCAPVRVREVRAR